MKAFLAALLLWAFIASAVAQGISPTPGGGSGGSGTVLSVAVTAQNGVSATVTSPTTTPNLTFTLGAITPTTVNGNTVPTATDTVALLAATQTLSAKTLSSAILTTAATFSFITGSTQCLHVSTTGAVSGTGSDCGAGGGGTPGGTSGQVQFNNAGSFGGFTVSADATLNTGTGALTLATVNANVGSFGSATTCTAFTTNAKGLITAASAVTCTPAVASLTGLGTGVATALAVNIGTAGSFVTNGGALGTPTSGVATNLTGTAAGLTAGNVTTNANLTGMVTSVGNAASLGSFSSTNLSTALTDETGSGAAVFGTAPTISSLSATTAVTLSYLSGGGIQCLHISNTGAVTGTGADCGSGSGGVTSIAGNTGAFTLNATSGITNATNDIKCQVGSAAQFGCIKVDGTTITASAGVISAVGGSGTVTSVAAGCGTSTGGSPITTTGTILAAITIRANTTTSDTITSTDCGNLLTESNASSIAVTLPQAGTTGFATGTFFQVCNKGVGVATITPTTSTIGGASTFVLPTATALNPVCVIAISDGTNYGVVPDFMVNAGYLTAGALPAGRMPAFTGDITTSAGAVATTLATVNANVGSFGSATSCTAFTVNAKGLITAASQATCTPAIGSVTGLGTGVATALGNNLSAAGGVTTTIASGTAAMGTSAIASATCATAVTVAATNVATTDVLTASFNGDPTAVTGYVPLTTGMLTIIPYPTSGNVNFKVCNNTSSSITPGAITLNWGVRR